MDLSQKKFSVLSWTALSIALALVIIAWGQGVSWKLGSISAYQWFPLLGLTAWVTMAEHYYLGTVRIFNKNLKKPKYFSEITEYLVLGCLILHPGILAIAQSKNGEGAPPASFYNYVSSNMKLAIVFGSISLLIFLSFEVFNRFKTNKTVQKYWLAISLSQILAMALIWIHGLRLGSNLGAGWFRAIWFIFGIALLPCFYIILKADIDNSNRQ